MTASSGNHGLACLDALARYGLQGRVVVPTNIAPGKRDKLERLGAELVLHGTDCEEPERLGRELGATPGCLYVSPYNDPDIIAGQGTLGLELLQQLPDMEVLFVSVG